MPKPSKNKITKALTAYMEGLDYFESEYGKPDDKARAEILDRVLKHYKLTKEDLLENV